MAPVPHLNWPADLFAAANIATIRSMSVLIDKTANDRWLCACGCGLPHNLAVSGLEGEPDDRNVVWFRTMSCKAVYTMRKKSVH